MRTAWIVFAALVCGFAGASHAAAQATTPPPGEGSISLTYQFYKHTGHFDKDGNKNTNGATESQVVLVGFDVGLPRLFALNVTLPAIASKYTGPPVYFVGGIETHPGPLDDGTYHAAVQDLRIEARRMFGVGRLAVAPFVSVGMPSHEYETQGEAVPGRHRTEFQFGASAATEVGRLLPHTFVQGRYAYATLERINEFPHTRSNIDAEVVHELTRRLALNVTFSWQIAHKGPKPIELINDWVNHDRFINSSFFNVSGGGSFRLNRTMELYVGGLATVSGNSGAHVARVFVFGVSRSLGSGFKGMGG